MPKEEKNLFYKKISFPNTSAFKKVEEKNQQIKNKLKLIFTKIEEGNLKQAKSLIKKFTNSYPRNHIGWIIYGDILKFQKNYSQAIQAYEKAINLEKNSSKVYLSLALIYSDVKNFKKSEYYCLEYLSKEPKNETINLLYASILYNLKKFMDAEKTCKKDILIKGLNKHNANLLALILVAQNKYIEAHKYHKISATEKPVNIDYVYNYATFLRIINKKKLAVELYLQNLESNPNEAKTFKSLAEISPESIPKEVINKAKESVLNKRNPTISRSNFSFGLWEYYSKKNKKEAFQHLKKANELYKPLVLNLINKNKYPHQEVKKGYEEIKNIFNIDILERNKNIGNQSTIPIFIIGMPRSGTTLVEQILSNHPRLTGGGELDFIFKIRKKMKGSLKENIKNLNSKKLNKMGDDYIKSISKLIDKNSTGFIDKMPGNFLYLGLINMMFPNAKFIHVSRDPVDTCFSMYTKMFSSHHEYAYDLEDLGKHYKLYSSLMDYWNKVLEKNIYNINYEDLVSNIDLETRNLLSFCNYRFNKRCISFHENSRPVATASNDQVRKKLYTSSIGRWKTYKKELSPLIKIIRG
jgi:tetratricopeptide (TPR) repeat protein